MGKREGLVMEVAIERTLSIGSSEDRRIIASEDASKIVDDLHLLTTCG